MLLTGRNDTDREQITQKPITEAPLIAIPLIECRVDWANIPGISTNLEIERVIRQEWRGNVWHQWSQHFKGKTSRLA